jgi:predicted RNA-binding Zn ribbon-like protein
MIQSPTAAYVWSSIGGHPALDLCNTVSWRLDPARRIERLVTAQTLVDWFCTITAWPDHQHLSRQLLDQPESAERCLHLVRWLRAATTRLLDARLGHATMQSDDIDVIAAAWRDALAVARTPTELPLTWTIEPTSPARLGQAIALSVAELVHRPDLSGLRRCDGDGCGWLFLDTTRNHSRRWCDPLDCGNRARVRSYTERHRTDPGRRKVAE